VDAGDASAAQVFRDMEPRLTEADKADPYLVVHSRNNIAAADTEDTEKVSIDSLCVFVAAAAIQNRSFKPY
jgi:hypothetical protein